jgi:hypothetical protein
MRLAGGKGLRDNPRVASDGKDFLIVWEDLANGKDPSTGSTGSLQAGSGQGWDVCGARVSGDGKLLEAKPLTLAGGDPASPGGLPPSPAATAEQAAAAGHNQARPDVAFSGGSYLVVFQGFIGEGCPGFGPAGHFVHQFRVTSDGKATAPVLVRIALGSVASGNGQVIDPVVVSAGREALVMGIQHKPGEFGGAYLGWRAVDAAGVFSEKKLQDHFSKESKGSLSSQLGDRGVYNSRTAAAMGPDGSLVARPGRYYREGAIRLYRVDLAGDLVGAKVNGDKMEGLQWLGQDRIPFFPAAAVAFDGEKYLVASEWVDLGKPGKTEIHGYFVGTDGKVISDASNGFAVAAAADKAQFMPAAAGGPKGSTLVVSSELRGIDDMKLVARIVKR